MVGLLIIPFLKESLFLFKKIFGDALRHVGFLVARPGIEPVLPVLEA